VTTLTIAIFLIESQKIEIKQLKRDMRKYKKLIDKMQENKKELINNGKTNLYTNK